MQISDLVHLRTPTDVDLSPDGGRAVVSVARIDLDDDSYRSDLWLVPTADEEPPRRFTYGPNDSTPRFSPDGRWLAFVRAPKDGKPQIHVMPAAGGEPRQVGEHPLGASALVWSPDSTRLAYVARVPEEGRYGTDEDIPPEKEAPRRITTLKYRLDNIGFTIDRRSHVFVVDPFAEEPEPTQLTRGDFEHVGPHWSPDGRWIAFVSARHESRDRDLASDVFVVASEGGDARQVTRSELAVGDPVFSPNGETIWFAAYTGLDVAGRNVSVWSVPTDGSAPAERLTDAEAHDLSSFGAHGQQRLLVDDDGVTMVRLERGAVELARFAHGSGEPTVLLDGHRQVHGYARAADVLVAIVTTDTSAGEVIAVRDGSERTLTDFGAELARKAPLSPMNEVETTANDGYPVHGWVVKPAGPGPFPVLFNIHGGPHTQYGYILFDEAQVYAGAGYAVVMGNPRGSAGYGEAHGRAVVHTMGTVDHADLEALLDAALEDPDLDADRVGVMGGSYGGYMTTWMIAHSGRFAAAISERACNAPDSFLGSSDIGATFVDLYYGDDPDQMEAQSPLAVAHKIRTPTLIIHSEHDWRCPLEQGQRLFVLLKRNGVETELLLFPGEGHELSRSGLPSHRVARFEAILDWWSRHLS